MIIAPIHIPQDPPKCPNCHNPENKIVCCANCGYKYPEENLGFWYNFIESVIMILIIFISIWLGVTLLFWAIGKETLLNNLSDQWDWVKGLFHRIY